MAKRKTENLALAGFTPGVKVDAMKPNDKSVRERKERKFPVAKEGITEPIVRTDLK